MRPATLSCLATLALLAGLFAAPPTARALDCGHRFVDPGDSTAYVRALCGEPDWMDARTELRAQSVYLPYAGRVVGTAYAVPVTVEVWVYDLGTTRFMEELTFVNGVLRGERPLGYGTRHGHRRRGALDGPVRRHEVADLLRRA